MHRPAIAILVIAFAVALAGCSTGTRPLANPPGVNSPVGTHIGRGRVDDQRTLHVTCLQQAHLPVVQVGLTGLQIGTAPGDPTITFLPTAGAAQEAQIADQSQAGEVIGNALLYPNNGSDAELTEIENCLAIGVVG